VDGCNRQNLEIAVVPSVLSSSHTRISKEMYELIAQKLFQDTCRSQYKTMSLEKRYPEMCAHVERGFHFGIDQHYNVAEAFFKAVTNNSAMSSVERNAFLLHRSLRRYKEDNLIRFTVRVKNPQITSIDHTLKMSSIALIAHVGGLIGLIAGFSITSLFELLFHSCALGFGRFNPVDEKTGGGRG